MADIFITPLPPFIIKYRFGQVLYYLDDKQEMVFARVASCTCSFKLGSNFRSLAPIDLGQIIHPDNCYLLTDGEKRLESELFVSPADLLKELARRIEENDG